MKQYDLFSKNGDRKLNEFPIEAETEQQLKAFISVGMMYDLESVYYKESETIKPSNLTFHKTHDRLFQVKEKGVSLYTGYVEKGYVQIINSDGLWDHNVVPLSLFEQMPNWNLNFENL